MSDPRNIDFDHLKPVEFEHILPDLFATGDGKVSQDPRLQKFLAANPDCATLVSDLETIAETARSLLQPIAEPSDRVWQNIQAKLQEDSALASIDDDYIDPDAPID
jgi:hypothetical protein